MRKLFFTVILIITTCSIYAQEGNYKSGSLLWKISGKDLSKPSYLLGTFHLKPGAFLDSIPGARNAFRSCEQVVGELTMTDMAAMQAQMAQAMMMNPDTTYQMLYSKEDYKFVDEKMIAILGAGLGQMGMLKPMAIQLAAVMMAYTKYFPDMNPNNVLDSYIQIEAEKMQKPVLGLESIDHQIYVLFGSMSLQRQADILLCYMKNMDQYLNQISSVIRDYDHGDLNNLYRLMKDEETCPSSEQEMDSINKGRNDTWMKKLPGIMKDNSSFIAVGALHLAGEEGLLNQLEKLGYKVEPVK